MMTTRPTIENHTRVDHLSATTKYIIAATACSLATSILRRLQQTMDPVDTMSDAFFDASVYLCAAGTFGAGIVSAANLAKAVLPEQVAKLSSCINTFFCKNKNQTVDNPDLYVDLESESDYTTHAPK